MKYNQKQHDPLDTLLTINLLFKGSLKEQGVNIQNTELTEKDKEEVVPKKGVNFHPSRNKDPGSARKKADTNDSDDSDQESDQNSNAHVDADRITGLLVTTKRTDNNYFLTSDRTRLKRPDD